MIQRQLLLSLSLYGHGCVFVADCLLFSPFLCFLSSRPFAAFNRSVCPARTVHLLSSTLAPFCSLALVLVFSLFLFLSFLSQSLCHRLIISLFRTLLVSSAPGHSLHLIPLYPIEYSCAVLHQLRLSCHARGTAFLLLRHVPAVRCLTGRRSGVNVSVIIHRSSTSAPASG